MENAIHTSITANISRNRISLKYNEPSFSYELHNGPSGER